MNKRRLFISHSQRDAALASRFESAIEKLGFDAFNPTKDVRPGTDWRRAIQEAIRKSEALLMILASPDAAHSSWVSYEAGMAEALGKRVFVLMPDRFPSSELPPDVGSRQLLKLDPDYPEQAAKQVAQSLAAA